MPERYQYYWTCKSCNQENSINRTKHQAAFDHSPVLLPCKNCGGYEQQSNGCGLVTIDIKLLETWYADPNLYFLEQDEDLIMASIGISVLQEFLNTANNKVARAKALGPVLAVKLHDEIFETPQDRDWCINWLRSNKEAWQGKTYGYILKKIKPIIDVTKAK